MGDFRRVVQAELGVLQIQLLFHPSVLLKQEAVVVIADEQYVVDMFQHQVAEGQPGWVEGIHSK
ncbi:hypothetical protein SDC9_55231 [bioreactor metagenome]|uniref:Uncharacterized protein n=1 Tax=bioreactor metagenome TaxID=1076179 RepID=A0A644WYC6_9ZZZZ